MHEQEKSTDIAQTNMAIADAATTDVTVDSEWHVDHEDDHYIKEIHEL